MSFFACQIVGGPLPSVHSIRVLATGHLLALQSTRCVVGYQRSPEEENQGGAGRGETGSGEEAEGESREEGHLQRVSGFFFFLFFFWLRVNLLRSLYSCHFAEFHGFLSSVLP